MRIAYVSNTRLPTQKANGIQIMSMCRAFARAGHEVTLFVPKRANPIAQDAWSYYGMEPSFRIVEVPIVDFIPWDRWLGRVALWLSTLGFGARLKPALEAFKPDVIYTREQLAVLRAPRGVMTVYEAHTFPRHATSLHLALWRRYDRVVTVTEGLRQDFLKAGVSAERVVSAHDAVDIEDFNADVTRAEARARFGLPEETFVAVYVGQLYPQKGASDLIAAAAKAPGVRVMVAGGFGRDLEEAQALASRLGAANVVFLGQVKRRDVPVLLRAADVAVLPNRAGSAYAERYTSPMKLFEYMAAGKAIVASDLPTVREVLRPEEAVLTPPQDPEALAAALRELAAHPDRRALLGRAAAAAATRHTWRARAVATLDGLRLTPREPGFPVRHRTELLVAAGAFIIRLAYILWFPQASVGGGDGPLYVNQADWIRGVVSTPGGTTPYFQIGYPLFLAGVRTIFGEDFLWIRVVQAAVSAVTILVMMRLASFAVSRRAALAAGLLGALHVPMVLESGVLHTETLYTFLLTLGAYMAFRVAVTGGVARAVGAGVVMAAAGATRELGFYTAALFACYLLVRRRPKLFVAFLIPIVAIAGTISFRNRKISETYDVMSPPLIAKRYEKTFEDPAVVRLLLAPERWHLYPEGVVRFFRAPHRISEVSSGLSLRSAFFGRDWAALDRAKGDLIAKYFLTLLHFAILAAAAFGLLRGGVRKEARDVAVIWIGFALVSIVIGGITRIQGFAMFEALSRYRFPIEPLIIVLAAAGLVASEDRRARVTSSRTAASKGGTPIRG